LNDSADDSDGGDGDAGGEGADHPLPMPRRVAATDGQESAHHGEDEERADQRDDRSLAEAGDRNHHAEVEAGNPADDGGDHEDAPRPPVEADMAIANPRRELQQAE